MNLTFTVCDIGNRYIRIQDITKEGEEFALEKMSKRKVARNLFDIIFI